MDESGIMARHNTFMWTSVSHFQKEVKWFEDAQEINGAEFNLSSNIDQNINDHLTWFTIKDNCNTAKWKITDTWISSEQKYNSWLGTD